MLILNPAASRITCNDCQLWMVDITRMEFDRYPPGHSQFGQRIPREPTVPTPCGPCPKCKNCKTETPSPKYGKQFDLSSKNQRTLELYHRVRSGALVLEADQVDEITQMNFGIIDRIYTSYHQQNLAVIPQVIASLPRM